MIKKNRRKIIKKKTGNINGTSVFGFTNLFVTTSKNKNRRDLKFIFTVYVLFSSQMVIIFNKIIST